MILVIAIITIIKMLFAIYLVDFRHVVIAVMPVCGKEILVTS